MCTTERVRNQTQINRGHTSWTSVSQQTSHEYQIIAPYHNLTYSFIDTSFIMGLIVLVGGWSEVYLGSTLWGDCPIFPILIWDQDSFKANVSQYLWQSASSPAGAGQGGCACSWCSSRWRSPAAPLYQPAPCSKTEAPPCSAIPSLEQIRVENDAVIFVIMFSHSLRKHFTLPITVRGISVCTDSMCMSLGNKSWQIKAMTLNCSQLQKCYEAIKRHELISVDLDCVWYVHSFLTCTLDCFR